MSVLVCVSCQYVSVCQLSVCQCVCQLSVYVSAVGVSAVSVCISVRVSCSGQSVVKSVSDDALTLLSLAGVWFGNLPVSRPLTLER